jgi:hypothetical protein
VADATKGKPAHDQAKDVRVQVDGLLRQAGSGKGLALDGRVAEWCPPARATFKSKRAAPGNHVVISVQPAAL